MAVRVWVVLGIVIIASATAAGQSPPRNMIFGEAAYDSGWVDVDSWNMSFDHNLGGDTDGYYIDVQHRSLPGFENQLGVHNVGTGTDRRGSTTPAIIGAEVYSIDGVQVSVHIGADDQIVEQLRVRIWQVVNPAWDSGWLTLGTGQHVLTHALGGDPDDYVVDLSMRDDSGQMHKRAIGLDRYMDGAIRSRGAAWFDLTDNTIALIRGDQDVSAHEMRVRIFKPRAANFDSGWTAMSTDSSIVVDHDLGGPWNDLFVYVEHRESASIWGRNTIASGGDMLIASGWYGSAWQALTGRHITLKRFNNDYLAEEVRVRIWASRAPAYDSGWVDKALGNFRTFDHALGGDPDNYVVDLQFKDTLWLVGYGINQRSYGLDNVYDEDAGASKSHGAMWSNLDAQEVRVFRAPYDPFADKVRIRIWRTPEPEYDSEWRTISAGAFFSLIHDLGGEVEDFVVDLQCRFANPGSPYHHSGFGGDGQQSPDLSTNRVLGSYWSRLSDNSISVYRNADDETCEEVRIRIWTGTPFDWNSQFVSIDPGAVNLEHNLGVPPSEMIVSAVWESDSPFLGVHSKNSGGDRRWSGGMVTLGTWWSNLSHNYLRIVRGADDDDGDRAAIRVWWTGDPGELFADGFDDGTTDRWSSTSGG